MLKIQRTRDRTACVHGQRSTRRRQRQRTLPVVDAEPAGGVLVLDLTDLVLADRDVVRFLRQFEAARAFVLRNCPAYIRTWMVGEKNQP